MNPLVLLTFVQKAKVSRINSQNKFRYTLLTNIAILTYFTLTVGRSGKITYPSFRSYWFT